MGVLRFDSYDFHPTAVLDAHPDGILVVDHGGLVRYANPAAASAFDTSLDGMVGRQFSLSLDDKPQLELRTPQGRVLRLRVVPTLWASRPARLVCLTVGGDAARSERAIREVPKRTAQSDEETYAMLVNQLDTLHDALDALQRSAGTLGAHLRASPVLLVQQAADTLADHAAALDALAPSEQVARLPDLLDGLARELNRDNATAVETAEQLHKTIGILRAELHGLRRQAARTEERTPPPGTPRSARRVSTTE